MPDTGGSVHASIHASETGDSDHSRPPIVFLYQPLDLMIFPDERK